MREQTIIRNERVDDIPIIIKQLEKMEVGKLIDKNFPKHGNWQGLSMGQVVVVWLVFILTEANHRLSHVENWAEQRLLTLKGCLEQEVRGLDFSDDRLGQILDKLSEDEDWSKYEIEQNQQIIRVYDLKTEKVRIDATSAKGYVEVSKEGLFQFGHSKEGRKDLPQIKVNISVLDPLGLPLTTSVISGEKADDPLYIPEIKKVQQTIEKKGVTYIGDSKMSAIETRAYVVKSQDYYLCPLSAVQIPKNELVEILKDVLNGSQELTKVCQDTDKEQSKLIAEGFEISQALSSSIESKEIIWQERRLVVRSLQFAQSQSSSLVERVNKAVKLIVELNKRVQGKKRYFEQSQLEQEVEKILTKYQVNELVTVTYECEEIEKTLRAYGKRPETIKIEKKFSIQAVSNQEAIEQAKQLLGWRVYATNQSREELSLQQAVLAYRSEYLVEAAIGRLKSKPLGLTPFFLQTDKHVIGLVRLLTIGLRVLTLIEFTARKNLQQLNSSLSGIYPGNPKRSTQRPTTEMMLQAFDGLTLTFLADPNSLSVFINSLSHTQERILQLLDFPSELYSRLSLYFSKSVFNLSEP
jgi:transposase